MLARFAVIFMVLLAASCIDDTASLSNGAAPRPIPTTPPNPPAAVGQGGEAGATEPVVEPSAGAAGAAGNGSSAGAGGVELTMEDCQPVGEVCNGEDDDCNGIIDDECPLSLAWDTSEQLPAIGDSAGGSAFAESCAKDEVLVGLKVATGAWVDQVSGICRKFELKATDVAPYQYSLAFLETRALAAHPSETSSEVHVLLCGDHEALVGLRISQQNYSGDGVQSVVIPSLWISCAEPLLDLDADGESVRWNDAVQIGPVSGSFANGTAWFAEQKLTSPALAVAVHGSAGSWIDRLGLGASTISAAFR
ncbi:MAG TPA: hypothetical protein VM686_01995 [Polyangiaceae bacterium]|nr:hypothetical protein [Polyangiaceae bacterium]